MKQWLFPELNYCLKNVQRCMCEVFNNATGLLADDVETFQWPIFKEVNGDEWGWKVEMRFLIKHEHENETNVAHLGWIVYLRGWNQVEPRMNNRGFPRNKGERNKHLKSYMPSLDFIIFPISWVESCQIILLHLFFLNEILRISKVSS